MMMTIMFLGLSLLFFGLLSFSMKYNHILIMLLSLEYMVLGMFFLLSLVLISISHYFCLYYLVFSTCEGALGLSLLVSLNRSYGSDNFFFMNF